jgi:Zn-dependent metalloprotease
VQANLNYWTKKATFQSAACGVMSAARDYKYNVDDVRMAMKEVGVSTNKCK